MYAQSAIDESLGSTDYQNGDDLEDTVLLKNGKNVISLSKSNMEDVGPVKANRVANFAKAKKRYTPAEIVSLCSLNKELLAFTVAEGTKIKVVNKITQEPKILTYDTSLVKEVLLHENENKILVCKEQAIYVEDLDTNDTVQLNGSYSSVKWLNGGGGYGDIVALSDNNSLCIWHSPLSNEDQSNNPEIISGGEDKITSFTVQLNLTIVYGTENGCLCFYDLGKCNISKRVALKGLENYPVSFVRVEDDFMIVGTRNNERIDVFEKDGLESVQWIEFQLEDWFASQLLAHDVPGDSDTDTLVLSCISRLQGILFLVYFDRSRKRFHSVEELNTNSPIVSHDVFCDEETLHFYCCHQTSVCYYEYSYHFEKLQSRFLDETPAHMKTHEQKLPVDTFSQESQVFSVPDEEELETAPEPALQQESSSYSLRDEQPSPIHSEIENPFEEDSSNSKTISLFSIPETEVDNNSTSPIGDHEEAENKPEEKSLVEPSLFSGERESYDNQQGETKLEEEETEETEQLKGEEATEREDVQSEVAPSHFQEQTVVEPSTVASGAPIETTEPLGSDEKAKDKAKDQGPMQTDPMGENITENALASKQELPKPEIIISEAKNTEEVDSQEAPQSKQGKTQSKGSKTKTKAKKTKSNQQTKAQPPNATPTKITSTSTSKKRTKKTNSSINATPESPRYTNGNSNSNSQEIISSEKQFLKAFQSILEVESKQIEAKFANERAQREKVFAQKIKQLEQNCKKEIQNSLDNLFDKRAQEIVTTSIRSGIRSDIQNALREPFAEELKSLFERTLAPTITDSCQRLFVDIDNSFQTAIAKNAQTATASDSVQQLTGAVSNLINVCNAMVGTVAQLGSLKQSMSQSVVQQPPPTPQPRELVTEAISVGDYGTAVSQTVHARDQELLDFCLENISDPYVWLDNTEVDQTILVFLIQQISVTLSSLVELKLEWIKTCLAFLHPDTPQLKSQVTTILGQLYQNLNHLKSETTDRKVAQTIQFMLPFIQNCLAQQS